MHQPEPRIAERIEAALGNARSVLNVGAGTGSYEPADRDVTALFPDATAEPVPIPRRCADGFWMAIWDRPQLDIGLRLVTAELG